MDGTVPMRKLFCNSRSFNEDNSPKEVGIVPVNWLLYRYKYFNDFRYPNDEGREPVKEFENNSKSINNDNCPKEDGIGPISELP